MTREVARLVAVGLGLQEVLEELAAEVLHPELVVLQ